MSNQPETTSNTARARPRGDEMKCTACERCTGVRLRVSVAFAPIEQVSAILYHALVDNMCLARVLGSRHFKAA